MKKIQRLELSGISKSFGEVHANRDISLKINSGEIIGLLGENGAGKTTLMNILFGIYQPDSGRILVNGQEVRIRNPRDSIAIGIGMVHQHFMLVENHTVSENVVLGYEGSEFFFPAKKIRRKLDRFSSKYGLSMDQDKPVWQLSAGEQQRVEIVKSLLNEADLIILDEPTSVLTPQEAEDLFSVLRTMRDEGHSVILISHKLEEILDICDRVVVLRKGEIVGSTDIESTDKKGLARMMVGRDVIFDFKKQDIEPGEPVLEVDSLTVVGDRGVEAVRNITFSVRRNEILGIAGVSGNGQKELVESITGLRRAMSGTITVEGEHVANSSARAANNMGITHVPEERIRYGIVPNLLIYDNAVLKKHHMSPYSNTVFLDYTEIKGHAEELVDGFRIDTPSISLPAKNLSGGNIQKLILGREITSSHSLLVAAHPTYGLDVGATEFIRNHLLERRARGGAVLLVTEDLEEAFELCDRIAVMFRGTIIGIVNPKDSGIEEVGLMMAGSLTNDGSAI